MAIDESAALKSASWGLGLIMGEPPGSGRGGFFVAQRPPGLELDAPPSRLDPTLPESWLGVPSCCPFGLVLRSLSGRASPPGDGLVDSATPNSGRPPAKGITTRSGRIVVSHNP
ncbi:hypothetical protein [Methylobacterium sp. yr668]|uniref:hypothetical protein n=1 Tax=Methylobacterium sp. yr668 TaxID=1761801 RepID=UPI00244EE18B|nr:hypothetical protein [Methylobacterium sp. yr668]